MFKRQFERCVASILWKDRRCFSDRPSHRILSWFTVPGVELPLVEGALTPLGRLLVLPMITKPFLNKQAHPDWHATKSLYQTWGSCWINLFFNSSVNAVLSGSLKCDSNTVSLIPGSLDSICSSSEVLLFQRLMAASNGEHRVFLMTLISQSNRHWFPSYCLGLCSLCLKKEWGVITKFSCLYSSQADPIHFHIQQPHKSCCWCQALSLLFRSLLILAAMTQTQCSPQMNDNSQKLGS